MPHPLKSKLDVAARHARILRRNLDLLASSRPLSLRALQDEDEELLLKLDQFHSRYTKLQDHLGASIFPYVLELLGEDGRRLPVLDRLDRLETLGFLPSAAEWLSLRNTRNQLAHEYPEQPEELLAELELGFQAGEKLVSTWQHFLARVDGNSHLKRLLSED